MVWAFTTFPPIDISPYLIFKALFQRKELSEMREERRGGSLLVNFERRVEVVIVMRGLFWSEGEGAMLIVNLLFVELILKYLFKMQAAGY